MHDEKKLDQIIAAAADEWRVPPPVPVEQLWARIETEAFQSRLLARRPGWWGVGIAAAAALTLGMALGRRSNVPAAAVPVVVTLPPMPDAASGEDPYLRARNELLGKTALLLAAIPEAGLTAEPSFVIAQQGGELLTTTRLLLDSPVAATPEMRALLEDLELVLVQVARLRAPGSGDLVLIHDALDRREIVPRLRSAVIGSTLDLH